MYRREKEGGSAFPVHGGYAGDDPRNQILGGGMSLRDWFAGQALAGGLANQHTPDEMIARGFVGAKEMMAEWAYAIADAMLAARASGADK